jgi:hypothetical protein
MAFAARERQKALDVVKTLERLEKAVEDATVETAWVPIESMDYILKCLEEIADWTSAASSKLNDVACHVSGCTMPTHSCGK